MDTIENWDQIETWLIALAAIPATFILRFALNATIKKISQRKNLQLLAPLSQPLSNLIFLAGLQWFADFAPLPIKFAKWLEGGIYIVTVLFLLFLIRQAALVVVEWVTLRTRTVAEGDLSGKKLVQGFVPLLRNLVTIFIFTMGAIMVLKHFNYDVLSLLTALGVGSLAVGLASKETLTNMISGFTLIIDRNLQPGDRVNIGGLVGDVDEIGLRSTRIRMTEGSTLIVPNSEVVNTKIINLSQPNRELACSLQFRVSMEQSFDRIRELCLSAIGVVTDLSRYKNPGVTLVSLAEGQQLIQVSFWVANHEQSGAKTSEINQLILRKMQEAKIPLESPPQKFKS